MTQENKSEIENTNEYKDIFDDIQTNWDVVDYIVQKLENISINTFTDWQQENLKGIQAYFNQDLETARKCFETSNNIKENGDAQHLLSIWYDFHSNDKDDNDKKKAIEYCRLAVKNNNCHAITNLSHCLIIGDGIEKDFEKGFSMLQKSIESGESVKALLLMTQLLLEGEEIKKNARKAFRYIQQAMLKDSIEAMFIIASCYLSGTGVKKNAREAFRYFQKASQKGYTTASVMLAQCFISGDGVEKDEEKGEMILKELAEKGLIVLEIERDVVENDA